MKSTIKLLKPFLVASSIWFPITLLISFFLADDRLRALGWTFVLSFLCLVDFLSTALVVRALLALAAGVPGHEQPQKMFQIFGWGSLKVACLALLAVVLWAGRNIPNHALLLGSFTLVAVPIMGGLIWFWTDTHKRSSEES